MSDKHTPEEAVELQKAVECPDRQCTDKELAHIAAERGTVIMAGPDTLKFTSVRPDDVPLMRLDVRSHAPVFFNRHEFAAFLAAAQSLSREKWLMQQDAGVGLRPHTHMTNP